MMKRVRNTIDPFHEGADTEGVIRRGRFPAPEAMERLPWIGPLVASPNKEVTRRLVPCTITAAPLDFRSIRMTPESPQAPVEVNVADAGCRSVVKAVVRWSSVDEVAHDGSREDPST